MRSHAARRLCALALALALLGPAAAAGAHAAVVSTPYQQQQTAPLSSASERIIVHVDGDGDARWTVSARFALDSEDETAAFRRLETAFENGSDDVGFDVAAFRTLADRASDDTGREMTIRNVSYDGRLTGSATNGTGVLNLSFQWTNFAAVDGDRVVVGAAFVDGWRLDAGQTLVVRPPPNHGITDFSPPPSASENGVLRWEGPAAFDDGEPSVTYLQGAGPVPTPDGPLSDPLVFGGAVLAALVVGGAGAYALVRRRPASDADEQAAEGEPTGEPVAADAADDDTAPEPTVDVEADAPAAAPSAEAATVDSADGGAASDGVDPALLSDEERVERLLEENGGRMKQADIVSETDWSNAKVSQLLSGMAEEGRVEKLRIGRENLISLPDEE